MAIQDDFTIDYVNRRITYTTAFVDDRPPTPYTVNELYSYLQDTFDEPGQMDDPIPMTAQTPTQYTLVNGWFMDEESIKALYGGSLQTSGWLKSGAAGITALRWQDTPTNAPDAGEIGETMTGGTSGATGILLAVDATRQVAWVRNTSVAQFADNEAVTGTDTNFNTMATRGVLSGENVWSNLFSVGSLQLQTEIYVGQEPDYMGGPAFHDADTDSRFERRIEKISEWWDSDVDFFTGSPNLLGGINHFDILVRTQEAGVVIDGGRLAVFARQYGTVYSSFEVTAAVGNFVVPFASTGADLNAADGVYEVGFDAGTGTGDLSVGDVLENFTGTTPVGRLRAVVTAVTGTTSGSFEYYLIGENEADGTLRQFADNEQIKVRDEDFNFDIDAVGTPVALVNGAASAGITITFADNQIDVDQDGTPEEYGCTIDCNNIALASVYQYVQALTCRGNQNGLAVAGTQDTLLPSGDLTLDEAGEFYRAIGDIIFQYDGGVGTQPTEGDLVTNGSGAYGVVVSTTAGTTGWMVLTQVKGTWANDDTVAEIDAAGGNSVTVNGAPLNVVDNTAAPFGTFAGGRWFVARGVVLTNVPGADANNWETVDLGGTRRAPPATRAITFAGLQVNDRAAIFEVGTPGGVDVVKNQGSVGAAGAAVSDVIIPVNTAPDSDVPATGWIRVVDVSDPDLEEYRYEYSSISGTDVNLRAVSGGTDSGASDTTTINITGIATNFGTDGNPKVGMMVRETTGGEWARVLRKIDNDNIETTPLSGGGTWSGKTVEFNEVVVALVDADDCYFPFIDDTATGTSLSKSIVYVADTPLVARCRFSDPDVGGTRILPFEQTGITLTDADLTVTAIRNEDTIAA